VLEFDAKNYDNSHSTPQISTQFESKSLDSMLDIGKKMQKSPQLLKERMLTIEEFYRQTPENVNPGRSSRLSRNFI
jgi:hypothetical protein